ncbi:hypothetical protein [Kineococcus rubinsiae]|uniref:hypothetical protein n=1 Tax=Kineococcus rubinsiae TaxID=2609562 RepID=UPI00142F5752|nr:hypothetical protein [Kineococcus rubinsiae]NIZ90473.1 hypothetical protein [Kineococcus rubinsiae]
MDTPVNPIQTWWDTATARTRQRALGLDPAEPVPGWLAEELTAAGVALRMALFTEGSRIARRYTQSTELRTHLAAERASVPTA